MSPYRRPARAPRETEPHDSLGPTLLLLLLVLSLLAFGPARRVVRGAPPPLVPITWSR